MQNNKCSISQYRFVVPNLFGLWPLKIKQCLPVTPHHYFRPVKQPRSTVITPVTLTFLFSTIAIQYFYIACLCRYNKAKK